MPRLEKNLLILPTQKILFVGHMDQNIYELGHITTSVIYLKRIPTKMIRCCFVRNFYCCCCSRLLSIDWGPDYDTNDVNVGLEYF